MTEKIVLVTGASAGVGLASAHALIDAGFTVYAVARRLEPMEPLKAKGARTISVDLTVDEQIVALVETVREEAGRLDVLVNNAAYGAFGALEDVPLDDARRQMEVNLFAAGRLTQLVLPMMRAQGSGRIIMVGSTSSQIWQPFGSWYHASKFALEGLTHCLRTELTPFGIDVVNVRPGAVESEWNAIAAEGLVETSGDTAYGPWARTYARKALGGQFEGGRAAKPEDIAETVVLAATKKKPKTSYVTGKGAKESLRINRMVSDRTWDKMVLSQATD